jgi:hypothetical protein
MPFVAIRKIPNRGKSFADFMLGVKLIIEKRGD